MKRTLSIFLVIAMLLSCAVFFSGCDDKKSSEYPVTVGDVTIEAEPQSIVVLNDCIADIISYIEYDYKMVGRSIECDQDFLRIVPSVGTPDNPAVDTIAQKGADLVIADSTLSEKVRGKIEAEGITVITLDPPTDTTGLKELYSTLGAVLGGNTTGRAKGEKSYDGLFDMLGQFKTASTGVAKTSVYLYMDQNGRLCTFVKGSLEYKIFGYNGAVNVLSNQAEAAVDATQLKMGSPSYIFYDDESVLDYLKNDEKLMSLRALQNGKTYPIPLKNFKRYGTTCEQAVYDMVAFLNMQDAATIDEATPGEATPDEYLDGGEYTGL